MRGSNSNYPSCPSSSVPRQIYSPATPSLFCTPKPPTSSTWVGARTGAGGGGRWGDSKCLVLPPAGPVGTLAPWGHWTMSEDGLGCCTQKKGVVIGIWLVEIKDAAKVRRLAPPHENDPASNAAMSLHNPTQGNGSYLGGCLEDTAAIRLPVWGWKAGTASSVYKPPSCRWFRLTRSVITTRPVS